MKKTDDRFDLPQGTLDLLIMRVVALGPIHGYKKLLSSRWKPSETGREAKFYELTSKGRTHLQAETENWTRLTDVVNLILEGTLEGI
jgi:PadR family transcriptional regulator, regulatory protein PadR